MEGTDYMSQNKLFFASDYQEGAHPRILKRLEETNLIQSTGYGKDDICESARERKCGAMLGEAVVIPEPELLPYFYHHEAAWCTAGQGQDIGHSV